MAFVLFAIGSTILLFLATTGFAGTGIGALFNLGQTNTVNQTSTLTGTKAGPMLNIVNNNTQTGATPLNLQAAAGKAPMTTNSSVKVTNFNADKVDGFHASGLGRLGMASSEALLGFASTATQTSVTITAPSDGFVRLDGSVIAYDGFASSFCADCAAYVRVKDDASGASSSMAYAEFGAGSHASSVVIPVQWIFPVKSGAHTYSLTTAQSIVSGGGFSYYNPILIAQFVPFNGAGSQTSAVNASELSPQSAAQAASVGSSGAEISSQDDGEETSPLPAAASPEQK